MSYTQRIVLETQQRLIACQSSGQKIVAELDALGVRAKIVGSTARADVHPESDVDILIFDKNKKTRGTILVLAESLSSVPVDVIFAEDLPEAALQRMQNCEE